MTRKAAIKILMDGELNPCVAEDREACDMAIKALEQEPTTKNDLALIHTWGLDEEIRCTMCTNYMKSDRGCDGSCVVNKDMYEAVMDTIEKRIQTTTKENLGVDKEQLKTMIRGLTKWYVKRDNTEVGEPNTAVGLLYDDIMFGIDRLPPVTLIRPKGHWIPIYQGDEIIDYRCSECEFGNTFGKGTFGMNFCPRCGSYNGSDNREVVEK